MILAIFYFCFCGTILFWIWFCYSSYKIINSNITSYQNAQTPVSIILAFKNEGQQILQTVTALLAQDYPTFEVLAIDDFSTDDGYKLLKEIKDVRFILLKATLDHPGKKSALTQAIAQSKYDIVLFTDADCLIGQLNMHGICIRLGIDRDRFDVQFLASPDDPDGNFTAVGDQYFFEHVREVDS